MIRTGLHNVVFHLKINRDIILEQEQSMDCINLCSLFEVKCPSNDLYKQRLNEELDLIHKFNFTKVFLQVQKIVQILKQLNIPHIIRGSSGSSLVCYLMGITKIDPIKYDLQLARFMNNRRVDLPDIDIDVPYNRREELFEVIRKQWPNKVAHVSNYITYGLSVATREVAKEYLKDTMSPNPQLRSPEEKKKLRAIQRKNFRLDTLIPDKNIQETIREESAKKVGTMKNYSLHCGGIVIFEEEGEVPQELRLDNEREDHKIQLNLNKDDVEDSGYIKIDLLSNRGLAILVEAESYVKQHKSLLDYEYCDSKISALFTSGDTIGLTFSESRGCRRVLMEMKPRHMEDIAIALAVIRPAAAGGGRKSTFLDKWKHGAEETEDPCLRPIVFDDDAILRIQSLLQCSAGEADRWRKVFAKEKVHEKKQFHIKLTLKGYSSSVIYSTLDDLSMLSYYSFCKSHAISYAQLVWALAWHKVYNTHAFWVSVLNHNHSEYRKWVMWREAKCSGLTLTREKGPWTLGVRNGKPCIKAKSSEQSFLCQSKKQNFIDFRNLGYWLSDSFLEGCGLWQSGQLKIDSMFEHKKDVTFCGLIACGRVYRRDTLVTFITIGVENGKLIDLDIEGSRGDLFSYVAVKGEGQIKKEGHITVTKIRGISLRDLEKTIK